MIGGMSFSTLPLSYCTNVHPAQTVDEVVAGLERYTAPMQKSLGRPVAAGLWLARSVIDELETDDAKLEALRETLEEHGLVCYTLNTFPYGNFHSERVKEQVYVPDWTTDERLAYTQGCARVLCELMPEGVEGSLSTVPLGFKGLVSQPGDVATVVKFQGQCIEQLLKLAVFLDELHDSTGRVIRLAIEPEPLCLLETTLETTAFFHDLLNRADAAGQAAVARRHLGVCYDVCHQSVEFEDVQASIASLAQANVRINKVHITCALQAPRPMEHTAAREALASFVEPRYLHQTLARSKKGRVVRYLDLDRAFCESPPAEFAEADCWRVHFHVPVNAERIGPLETTRADLRSALAAVRQLEYAPHLEVETYTWGVLPGEDKPDLVTGLTAEMQATHALLEKLEAGA
jgi:sugar phosphate isomerase/epimerase